MFLISLDYCRPLTEVDAHLEAHRAFLARHYATGMFLLSGPKNPRSGGLILAHAGSHEALQAVLAQDPFHVHGVARYTITEFHPRAAAPALAHLIEPAS